jgi:hypothetical protein
VTGIGPEMQDGVLLRCSEFHFKEWDIPAFVVRSDSTATLKLAWPHAELTCGPRKRRLSHWIYGVRQPAGTMASLVSELMSILGGEVRNSAVHVTREAKVVGLADWGYYHQGRLPLTHYLLGAPTMKAWITKTLACTPREFDDCIAELSAYRPRVTGEGRVSSTHRFDFRLIELAIVMRRAPLVIYSSVDLDPVATSCARLYVSAARNGCSVLEVSQWEFGANDATGSGRAEISCVASPT